MTGKQNIESRSGLEEDADCFQRFEGTVLCDESKDGCEGECHDRNSDIETLGNVDELGEKACLRDNARITVEDIMMNANSSAMEIKYLICSMIVACG